MGKMFLYNNYSYIITQIRKKKIGALRNKRKKGIFAKFKIKIAQRE